MSKTRVLIVSQEMQPYTAASEIANIARKLPQYIQENGMEIRVLMPRFGTINERRHRLHEVVRLSGMNIIVDDDDYPLIIKVASLPEARMQVYFLDNEDFFKRKRIFTDADDQPFEDNPDRMVFFCKGVIETVKKFGWAPDVVFCNGWMTSLIPLYLKTAYKNEPLFQNAKVVYSIYNGSPEKTFSDTFMAKASINNLTEDDLSAYQNGKGVTLHHGAINFADALIQGSEQIEDDVKKALSDTDKPVLDYQGEEGFEAPIKEFFETLVTEEVEES
ncbi:MAG: glycogen/starch synthase [Phaeodactylibacter xiamenensis]|uniref:starch synthase n=1 Tax=Phaeodactylibacter xiamenensis TaxID=1524460 RepID=A0A098SDU2_9BACT|nr:glycogen/starch synthase [Phaeodactylibacter xiamenensis]KGE89192.1 starch synthase [Phaeodactylibacter xiamenensis]